MQNETRVAIISEADIVTARQKGRSLATELGFDGSDLTVIATAISEVARNIVVHAKEGEIVLAPLNHGNKRGISIIARDEGPGIAADELPKLFRRFWRGPMRRNDGAGLGLSICAEIAAAHNWELSARSTGRGAQFILSFRPMLVPAPR